MTPWIQRAALIACATLLAGCAAAAPGTAVRDESAAGALQSTTVPQSTTAPPLASSTPPADPSPDIADDTDDWDTTADDEPAYGDDVPDSAIGLKVDAPPISLTISGDTGELVDQIAAASLTDQFDYYGDLFPAAFNQEFAPPKVLISYNSTETEGEICGTKTHDFENAFFDQECDTIAWDSGVMLQNELDTIGVLAPATTIAHELGHSVQYQLGLGDDTPTLVTEQQADCYSGAYWRWVADGNSRYFTFNQTEGMRQLLLSMFASKDGPTPPDDADSGDATAAEDADPVVAEEPEDDEHGGGFDRTYATVLGYVSGAERCSTIDVSEIKARGQQFPFQGITVPYSNLDITAKVITGIAATANTYFAETQPWYVAPKLATFSGTTAPECLGYAPTFPVGYCPTTNTVYYQLAELQQIGTPSDGWEDTMNGDFSAIVLVVARYAHAAQHANDAPVTGKRASLQALCYTGAWAQWMREPHGGYQLSPFDLDKAVYQILTSPLAGSDANGKQQSTTIERVQAFSVGVMDALPNCSKEYAN